MNMTMAVVLLLGIFVICLIVGFEIPVSVLAASVAALLYMGMPVTMAIARAGATLQTYNLLAIPLFIVAGEILSDGSLSERIIEFVDALVGWMRGGMAIVNILASTFFGGISGSPLADISSLGTVLIPMMKKQGYDADFATDVTITSAQQGLLIPPSHNMIIYAMAAGGSASIAKLFMAGIAPGLLLALVLMVYSYYLSVKRHYPKGDAFQLKKVAKTFFTSFWGLMTLAIIIIGCTTGICTATEAAAVSILWALLVTRFIYKDMTWKRFWALLGRAVKIIAVVMLAMGFSAIFGWMLAFLKVPLMLTSLVTGFTTNRYMILLLINVILIFLGMIMDMGSLLVITTPILLPLAQSVGVDPVHFGIIMIFNLAIGMMTPPVGGALMIGSIVSGIKMEHLAKSLVPWLVIMFITLMLITYIPAITMTLPGLVE
ncbi:MAG: TRAP transporter large permease [Clostridiales bacterium]|nr:TRAP transporter large permease [Clostridiales bacterium]